MILHQTSRTARLSAWSSLVLGLCLATTSSQAILQFDVFLGYGGQPTGIDGAAREAGWFALGCELFNDGPGFDAVVEIRSADGRGGQARRLAIELPTNTRKRFVLPVFASSRGGSWDVRLLDSRGKVRAEVQRVGPRSLAWQSLLVGAVPRSYGGAPQLPPLRGNNPRSDLQPLVARIPVEFLPDDPIAYEGLNALYLNSERAVAMRDPQVDALLTWVQGGGHLILAVEQPADVTATPWLRTLLPCSVGESVTAQVPGELYRWLRWEDTTFNQPGRETSTVHLRAPQRFGGAQQFGGGAIAPIEKYRLERPRDLGAHEEVNPYRELRPPPGFEGTEFSLISARLRDGQVSVTADDRPLVVSGHRGRGRVTVLLFSPEREPFRSWKDREWFWARLLRVPPGWYTEANLHVWGGYSLDGVIGAMIDSRQVRKLPVQWLLLLLVAYLIVIGPLDQFILKRLNRQMLTWITFPSYVVLFSLLIYYLGYRLRAGETEWNELHLVDVVTRADLTQVRGRTYASIYSPVNARYELGSNLPHSTLRGEFLGVFGGSGESGRMDIEQLDRGFRAEVFVPVWTSQLVVCEWTQADQPPLEVVLTPKGAGAQVTVRNHLDAALADVLLVWDGLVLPLGSVPARNTREFRVETPSGAQLQQMVLGPATRFMGTVEGRQRAFGAGGSSWIDLSVDNLLALSFVGLAGDQFAAQQQCLAPEGTELSSLIDRGDAVVLAWAENHAALPNLRRFRAIRSQQNTLYRVAIPLRTASPL